MSFSAKRDSSPNSERSPSGVLRVDDHRRDLAGLTYVYPVVSRRAGGVSVGVNLNPNNACNWQCIYCQVPDLQRGGPPPIDLVRLRSELQHLLREVMRPDYLTEQVPEGFRRIADVAFSGNGEPTSAAEFAEAVEVVLAVLGEIDFSGQGKAPILRLITNGSLLHRAGVQAGIRRLGEAGGEVWFKVDRATSSGIVAVNQIPVTPEQQAARLEQCLALAPTWLQSCWFALDGKTPDEQELVAFENFVGGFADRLAGVHLYGIARPSQQPEAARLSALSPEQLETIAERLRRQGCRVTVSP